MSSSGVALVIGSGGIKCAAAIGLQRCLQHEAIPVELLVGCSGGAIYAAAMALGHDAETVARLTTTLWTREITASPDRLAMARMAFPRLLGFTERFGLKRDHLVNARLAEAFGDATFADCRTPLFITATDFRTGEQVIINHGRIADAIRASIAIPFAFRPWEIDGRLCVDGFLSDPLPVGVAVREGAHVIVAMGFESPYQERISTGGRFAFQLSSIMTNNLLRASFAFHGLAHHGEVLAVIPKFSQRIRLFDTARIPLLIDEGEAAMRAQLPYLRRLLATASSTPPAGVTSVSSAP
ncbi:MAG: patatin-like phospholipase family protein [Gemmatimonadaceae bacterium]|jgi:NTE family protein|nr:patatin-like phospholipase family protein [Gemmatimonadaceae bacterium]